MLRESHRMRLRSSWKLEKFLASARTVMPLDQAREFIAGEAIFSIWT